MFSFSASLHAAKIDREGEATVVLKVPSSDLRTIAELALHTQELLQVEIKPE